MAQSADRRDLEVDTDEELQPLDGAPRSAHRGGGRRRAALVALGLVGAAAATYSLASRGRASAAAPAGELEALFQKPVLPADFHPKRSKLAFETDLGRFVHEVVAGGFRPAQLPGTDSQAAAASAGPAHGLGSAFAPGISHVERAINLFKAVMERSGVQAELTSPERRAFQDRFVAKMIKMADTNDGPSENFIARARRHLEESKPVLTKLLAEVANLRQNSFTVKFRDWMLDESVESFKSRLIKVPFTVPEDKHATGSLGDGAVRDLTPPSFDSRDMWPMCRDVIAKAHNQGRCGSCWVFGALGSLDSRMCIKTFGKFSGSEAALSRGYGASCAVDWDGCEGGWPHQIFDYIEKKSGIPSADCVPYFGGADYANHWTSSMAAPSCPSTCDKRHGRDMQQDFFRPLGVGSYRVVTNPDVQGLDDMRSAIYTTGPVPYALAASYEFMGYEDGIFDGACGESANHAVQAIGFGEGYFLSLNSWGDAWGDGGRFKVAPCMVWHFVIPGALEDGPVSEFPLPFPPREDDGSPPLDAAAQKL